MNTMIRFFGLASIAASVIATAGCAAPVEPSAGDLDGMELIAAAETAMANPAIECPDDDEVDFYYTEIGPNQYMFYHRAPIDAPIEASWAPVSDFETFVNVCLDGVVSDFQWLDGGAGQAPSTCQFIVGGETVVEEVTEVDDAQHVTKFRVVEPVLGIEDYSAVVKLVRAPCNRSVLYWVTNMTLQPGVPVDSFAALFESEPPLFKQYVESLNP